jgi:hypothetical protein
LQGEKTMQYRYEFQRRNNMLSVLLSIIAAIALIALCLIGCYLTVGGALLVSVLQPLF